MQIELVMADIEIYEYTWEELGGSCDGGGGCGDGGIWES